LTRKSLTAARAESEVSPRLMGQRTDVCRGRGFGLAHTAVRPILPAIESACSTAWAVSCNRQPAAHSRLKAVVGDDHSPIVVDVPPIALPRCRTSTAPDNERGGPLAPRRSRGRSGWAPAALVSPSWLVCRRASAGARRCRLSRRGEDPRAVNTGHRARQAGRPGGSLHCHEGPRRDDSNSLGRGGTQRLESAEMDARFTRERGSTHRRIRTSARAVGGPPVTVAADRRVAPNRAKGADAV